MNNEAEADSNSARGDIPSPGHQPPKPKKSSVFERRSVVFGAGDNKKLEELVKVAYYNEWPVPNKSTMLRALIRIAYSAYQGGVFPVSETPWVLFLDKQIPSELNKIKGEGAPRGKKPKLEDPGG